MDNFEVYMMSKVEEVTRELITLNDRVDKIRDHINNHVSRTLIMLLDKQGLQIDSQWKLVDKKEGAVTPDLGASYSGGHFV